MTITWPQAPHLIARSKRVASSTDVESEDRTQVDFLADWRPVLGVTWVTQVGRPGMIHGHKIYANKAVAQDSL